MIREIKYKIKQDQKQYKIEVKSRKNHVNKYEKYQKLKVTLKM